MPGRLFNAGVQEDLVPVAGHKHNVVRALAIAVAMVFQIHVVFTSWAAEGLLPRGMLLR